MKTINLGRHGDKGYAKVDDVDFAHLNKFTWTPVTRGRNTYAVTNKYNHGNHLVYMHHEIMGENLDFSIDHQDRDGLNNQRSNLRQCNAAQNLRNKRKPINGKGQYIGVHMYIEKNRTKWRAVIGHDGTVEHLGMFDDEFSAAVAYDEAAKKYFGEFANLNFG